MTDISASRGRASFPPWHQDYIPTADEWLNCFSNKADEASLEAVRKALFPNGNDGAPTAQESVYSRLSSLEHKEARIARFLAPSHYLTGTYDDVDATFFAREQASIATKLSAQLSWAASQQQQARFIQRMIVEARKAGLYK